MTDDTTASCDAVILRNWTHNREGQWEEALAILASLVEHFPIASRAHFEYAGALGLSGDDLPRLYVQLGSTLRNVGEFAAAERFLAEGRDRFPDHAAIQVFHALALVSVGRCQDAVVALLDLITKHAGRMDLEGYDRTLHVYSDELRSFT